MNFRDVWEVASALEPLCASLAARQITDDELAQLERSLARTEAIVESYGDKSIVVLPFINMSSDKEQEYFSDGISEELLNLLAQIPELRVISHSSAFSFKGRGVDVPTAALTLASADWNSPPNG